MGRTTQWQLQRRYMQIEGMAELNQPMIEEENQPLHHRQSRLTMAHGHRPNYTTCRTRPVCCALAGAVLRALLNRRSRALMTHSKCQAWYRLVPTRDQFHRHTIVGDDYLGRPSSSGRVSSVLELGWLMMAEIFFHQGARRIIDPKALQLFTNIGERPDPLMIFTEDGWFRTGDIAYIDKEEWLLMCRPTETDHNSRWRKTLVVASRASFGRLSIIIEACVYGVPDERLDEEVCGPIYATDNQVDVAALQESLKNKLANFESRNMSGFRRPLTELASGKSTKKSIQKSMFSNWIPKDLGQYQSSQHEKEIGTILYCWTALKRPGFPGHFQVVL